MDVPERVKRASRGGGVLGDVLERLVSADGMSHVRALAYETTFIALSGFIGIVGLASLLHAGLLRGIVEELGHSIAPGPAGRLLGEAARRGTHGGGSAATVGLAAAFTAGTLAMAQVERSANRIAGSSEERSFLRRYIVAGLLAATVGVLLTAGALILGAGRAIGSGAGWTDDAQRVWWFLRWPIGVVVVGVAIGLLFRLAPRRRLGTPRAILGGTLVAVALWATFTGLLSLYFSLQGSTPYGPLLSIVALLFWSFLTSLALHLGMATACELSGAGELDRKTTAPAAIRAEPRVGNRQDLDVRDLAR